jgi:hypothetical protein
MEATRSSETSVFTRPTRCHISEDGILQHLHTKLQPDRVQWPELARWRDISLLLAEFNGNWSWCLRDVKVHLLYELAYGHALCRQHYRLNVLCKYVNWPPLWSRSQSSWLQIQRSGFDSRRYHIFWEVVGMERGPRSLMSTIEELLGRKSNGSDLESREYGRRVPLRWPRDTLYPQNLALWH